MRNKPLLVLRAASKWRLLVYVLVSAALAACTILLLIPSLMELYDSVSFVRSFLQFIVRGSLDGTVIIAAILVVLFSFYLYLFYLSENHRYTALRIRQLTKEVERISWGDFQAQVVVRDHNELGTLAANMNNIVVQAKKAMEEERRAEQIKNDLVTNVSHDLRTPLTSIIGYLDLINSDKYRDEVELRYYTQILHDKAERLHDLINDLFEYTRMQNKGLKLHKEPLNIAEMLDQLLVQFRLQLQHEGMKCRQTVEAVHPIVWADGNKLVRVFENLLINAITYGKEGAYIDILLKEEGQKVIVEMSNYGEPIPSIDLPHLFDRFYRVEKSRSEHSGGSGLGLAIAKSIVELHEGAIEVESDSERTLFRVILDKIM